MGSITQSPDRVAQVLSGSAIGAQGAGDSAVQRADSNIEQLIEPAFTGISAAEIVYENKQQHSSVSEGVASAGHPPLAVTDRMDEFVPNLGTGEHPEQPVSIAAGCEGETSGGDGHDGDAAGGSNGYAGHGGHAGQGAHGGGGPFSTAFFPNNTDHPMDYHAMTSVLEGPSPSERNKRKNYSDVSDVMDAKRAEGLNRVPSDLAMVIGLSDGEGGDPVEPLRATRQTDACDSNVAGILAGVAAAPTIGEGDTAPTVLQMHPMQGQLSTGVDVDNTSAPTDADIIAWENQIREAEVRNVPLVGDVEEIRALEQEYRYGSKIFLAKISALRRSYTSIRRTRGDGNCFFRSFIFGYLESIIKTSDLEERDRAVRKLHELKQQLLESGYDELVIETPLEMLLGLLDSITSTTEPLTVEALEHKMREEEFANYIVFLLRIITSAEVKRRAEFFAPFIMGLSDLDVDTFCRQCVDPMGEESDHVQLVALTDAMLVPVRVVYLDRTEHGRGDNQVDTANTMTPVQQPGLPEGGGASYTSVAVGGGGTATATSETGFGRPLSASTMKVDVHDFTPANANANLGNSVNEEPRVHLLYRPGHYDLLYPKHNEMGTTNADD